MRTGCPRTGCSGDTKTSAVVALDGSPQRGAGGGDGGNAAEGGSGAAKGALRCSDGHPVTVELGSGCLGDLPHPSPPATAKRTLASAKPDRIEPSTRLRHGRRPAQFASAIPEETPVTPFRILRASIARDGVTAQTWRKLKRGENRQGAKAPRVEVEDGGTGGGCGAGLRGVRVEEGQCRGGWLWRCCWSVRRVRELGRRGGWWMTRRRRA